MAAVEAPITEAHHFFIGEDRPLLFYVTSDGSTPQPMTGWTLTYELLDRRGGEVLISKTVGSGIAISNGLGTDDLATVTIEDTDTDDSDSMTPEPLKPGQYFHVLRRTTAGAARVLAFGDVHLQKANA